MRFKNIILFLILGCIPLNANDTYGEIDSLEDISHAKQNKILMDISSKGTKEVISCGNFVKDNYSYLNDDNKILAIQILSRSGYLSDNIIRDALQASSLELNVAGAIMLATRNDRMAVPTLLNVSKRCITDKNIELKEDSLNAISMVFSLNGWDLPSFKGQPNDSEILQTLETWWNDNVNRLVFSSKRISRSPKSNLDKLSQIESKIKWIENRINALQVKKDTDTVRYIQDLEKAKEDLVARRNQYEK